MKKWVENEIRTIFPGCEKEKIDKIHALILNYAHKMQETLEKRAMNVIIDEIKNYLSDRRVK